MVILHRKADVALTGTRLKVEKLNKEIAEKEEVLNAKIEEYERYKEEMSDLQARYDELDEAMAMTLEQNRKKAKNIEDLKGEIEKLLDETS